MEIYFVFFFPPAKEGNPTHIAHIAKAPLANAETNALSKSTILPTHRAIFRQHLYIAANL
jgi:hypothetical protein